VINLADDHMRMAGSWPRIFRPIMISPRILRSLSRGFCLAANRRNGSLRNLSRAAAAIFIVGVLGGCGTGEFTYVTKISTGKRLEFPLVKGVPAHAKEGSVEVLVAGLRPTGTAQNRGAVYQFAFVDKSGAVPKAVRVDDVSDETAMMLAEDLAPKLVEHRWLGQSRQFTGDDAALHWLTYVDDSFRVYRFTITEADGRQIVLYQPWMVPHWAKASMRIGLGMK